MKIDIHTHVLPGVDDGARDWDECLQMLIKSVESGVTDLVATPHCIPWEKGAPVEDIIKLCQEAESKLKKEHGMTLNVYPGHEVYYVPGIVESLKSGQVLSLAGTRYVLVEFKPASPYQELFRAAREFCDAGYIPIYAHVERYRCLRDMNKMQELKGMGVLFQMNVKTFQGGIFDKESRRAKRYLKKEKIDFLASDMHDVLEDSFLTSKNLQWIFKKLRIEYRKKLLHDNGQKILDDAKR